jgi:hypothetical protein
MGKSYRIVSGSGFLIFVRGFRDLTFMAAAEMAELALEGLEAGLELDQLVPVWALAMEELGLELGLGLEEYKLVQELDRA